MSSKMKWDELVDKINNEEDSHLKDIVLLIEKESEEPSQEGYDEILAKFEEVEPIIKELPAKMYVEIDRLIRGRMLRIYDKLLDKLEKTKNIRKKTKWELFVDEARKKDWKPVIEVIDLIERMEEGTVTKEVFEEVEKKINEIEPYLNKNLSPFESDWAEREFNKRKRILVNKIGRSMNESLGDYIKALRKAKGYSLKELENITQISASYINRLENGSRKTLTIPMAEKLAKGLDVPVQEFLTKLTGIKGKNEEDKDVVLELTELLVLNSYTIKGKKATKEQKEALINLVNAILSATWDKEKIFNEQMEIMKLVDCFKKSIEE
ncbi:anaerobic benzoate catabolism transcriptional regulator [Clostridium sp. N3C]|uniref:helix-turn-helix domain-containing protein n=1 Tax=Clostridium sp. N3C TaxID=1776758 RepID=UPI00092E1D64|nr:helix-turn-helix transcriptional regulator [Clostridium sp. N3C]NLZ34620.1 helix-turn-helix transcriptional regulator [Clostridiales bacterium]SCN26029.1 anaerobic benzoate catabolism transcriptional regulator [Clostridium sp. N3C]